jgi:hypothetical protein
MGLTVDYITIRVNRRFLTIVSILVGVFLMNVGVYKFAYNKGAADLYSYITQLSAESASKSSI